jgi:two-component system chemotaxis response regulator CheB
MPARPSLAEQRARGGRELRAFLEAHEALLAASAVAAGLGAIRTRSAPVRLAAEAHRFVRLLAAYVGRMPSRSLHVLAAAEVRTGAFAASSLEQRTRVIDLWRRVVPPILAGERRPRDAEQVQRALDRMERELAHAAADWDPQRIDLVVVGASAGGLAALTDMVAPLEAALPTTVLVVLHVSERSPGLIPTLLARHSRLEIAWAVEGAALHLGHAFVAPPGRHLLVRADALALVEGPPIRYVRPSVDLLFASAAETFGRRVAAVVLSGTGSDGAAGIRAVRAHGGLTFAQDPTLAEFRGMPEAAIGTGEVDWVLKAEGLGEALRGAVTGGRSALAAA